MSGAGGRPPKSTKLKLLQGSPGKRPLGPGEPQPAHRTRLPRAPEILGTDGKALWRKLGTQLKDLGLLTKVDETMFLGLCQQYDVYMQALEGLENGKAKGEQLVVQTTNGNVIQNPWFGVANTALANMKRIGAEFGISPGSRRNLSVTDEEKDNLDRWMYGGNG